MQPSRAFVALGLLVISADVVGPPAGRTDCWAEDTKPGRAAASSSPTLVMIQPKYPPGIPVAQDDHKPPAASGDRMEAVLTRLTELVDMQTRLIKELTEPPKINDPRRQPPSRGLVIPERVPGQIPIPTAAAFTGLKVTLDPDYCIPCRQFIADAGAEVPRRGGSIGWDPSCDVWLVRGAEQAGPQFEYLIGGQPDPRHPTVMGYRPGDLLGLLQNAPTWKTRTATRAGVAAAPAAEDPDYAGLPGGPPAAQPPAAAVQAASPASAPQAPGNYGESWGRYHPTRPGDALRQFNEFIQGEGRQTRVARVDPNGGNPVQWQGTWFEANSSGYVGVDERWHTWGNGDAQDGSSMGLATYATAEAARMAGYRSQQSTTLSYSGGTPSVIYANGSDPCAAYCRSLGYSGGYSVPSVFSAGNYSTNYSGCYGGGLQSFGQPMSYGGGTIGGYPIMQNGNYQCINGVCYPRF